MNCMSTADYNKACKRPSKHIRARLIPKSDHLIGLDICECIKDIHYGRVNIDKVDIIYNNMYPFQYSMEWKNLIKYYQERDWHTFADEAKAIMDILIDRGKIVTPRVTENRFPLRVHGEVWTIEEEIKWEKMPQ